MRAIVIREPGGPDVLELRDLPDPEVPYGHVRIRVRYAGVNRADLLQRAGFYPAPPGAPARRARPRVSRHHRRRLPRRLALRAGAPRARPGVGGAYAEKVIAHEHEVAPLPEGLDDREAAAAPEAFVTAYDALVTRGRLAPGERVLVHAAGSAGHGRGAGGRALTCLVVGTSRTADKLGAAASLGMNAGVVPEKGAFAKAVLEATGGRGVDVVLDLVGGDYVRESMAACAPSWPHRAGRHDRAAPRRRSRSAPCCTSASPWWGRCSARARSRRRSRPRACSRARSPRGSPSAACGRSSTASSR